jgi:hypothetical protein
MDNTQVDKYWRILNQIGVVSIVYASPRPGTDFLQSLLDSHPQVLTFDGWLVFHKFYNESIAVFGTEKFIAGLSNETPVKKRKAIIVRDFFYEFAWSHLHKFDSRYDTLENKNKLGVCGDEYNVVDIDQFVMIALQLMGDKEFSSRNVFLATYGAYALARSEDLSKKKILIHHVHVQEYIPDVVKDFPNLKVISCIRDPRVYATKIKKYIEKIPLSKLTIMSTLSMFNIMISGSTYLANFKGIDVKVNILERLHQNPEEVMNSICEWLGIEYSAVLLKSTWKGKVWHGDNLSDDIKNPFSIDRYEKAKKEWETDLSLIDQIVVNNLVNKELSFYAYEYKYVSSISYILLPLLIIIPTKYELGLFISISKSGKYRLYFWLFVVIIKRVWQSLKKLKAQLRRGDILYEAF